MNKELAATFLTGIAVFLGIWGIVHQEVESVRVDMAAEFRAVNQRIDNVNERIDNILLADRK